MQTTCTADLLNGEIDRVRQASLQNLTFPRALEDKFEADTAGERSHRFWWEGLLAIFALNACLILDLLMVREGRWRDVVLETFVITPLALCVNLLMRRQPPKWLREGSVALASTLICYISLYVEGNATAAATTFGLMCVLLTVLFADVVMRLRFPYAAAVTILMFAGGLDFLLRAAGLQSAEKVIGASLLTIGVAITMTASYSLERQERLSYLLSVRGVLQTEELAILNTSLRELSTLDKLTGLPNRRALDERFEELWNQAEQSGTPLSAILIDVDHFKIINDVLGHLYGDQVLARIAHLIPQALRGQADLASRFGGEEFVVLLPDTNAETALIVSERIRSLVENAGTPAFDKHPSEPVIWVTVSCGVATCLPSPALGRNDLLQAADLALYASKAAGRNRVSCHDVEHRLSPA